MNNPKRYFIIQLTNKLWLESYMGSSVISTTSKERAFEFYNESTANMIATKYDGTVRPQRDWWTGFKSAR